MKTLSLEEYRKRYPTTSFSAKEKLPTYFNTKEALSVFEQASQDINTATQTFQKQPTLTNSLKASATDLLQGGLAPFRAVGAGFLGTETGQNVSQATVEGLTSFGQVITPDVVKNKIGDMAMEVEQGFNAMSPQEQLDQRNKLAVAEGLSNLLGLGAAKTAIKPITSTLKNSAQTTTVDLAKNSEKVFKDATSLKENIRSYVGEKSVEPQFTASVERIIKQPNLTGTAERVPNIMEKYDAYLEQSKKAVDDIKADPAVSSVGENIGKSFDTVIRQRQGVGKALGNELDEVAKFRVSIESSVQTLLKDLEGGGLSYNPKTRQLTSFQGTRFATQEIDMLQGFVMRMNLLGRSPNVRDIDNFIARTRTTLDFTKGESGVLTTTNAERIINGAIAGLRQSLDPANNGISQLGKYHNLIKAYSDLSDFVKEGATYLGKETQSGDYAKDASIAKSAVQSILNNGKKDWLLRLEALTGYKALDEAVLALQAMKDAGDFRGLSLLQKLNETGIPMTHSGFVGKLTEVALDTGKRIIAGKPEDQTRAFLKSLTEKLSTPNPKVQAPKGIPKTKDIQKLEGQIAKNVDAQKIAIKAGDFDLVKELKDVYELLVVKLKEAIKAYKEMSPKDKQGGFVNFGAPLKSGKPTKLSTGQTIPSTDSTTVFVTRVKSGSDKAEFYSIKTSDLKHFKEVIDDGSNGLGKRLAGGKNADGYTTHLTTISPKRLIDNAHTYKGTMARNKLHSLTANGKRPDATSKR